jgi:hypothetical protein
MRNFGSVEDILAMIEEGDQGENLRPRVNAIRGDLAGIQALQGLWGAEKMDKLVEWFLTSTKFRRAIGHGPKSVLRNHGKLFNDN